MTALGELFWSKVNKTESCWLWTAVVKRNVPGGTHGQFGINGKMRLAHRLSWTERNGEIPKGMCVLHRCDEPRCVNPDHLYLGTQRDNGNDKRVSGRPYQLAKRRTHCRHGHAFTEANTYRKPGLAPWHQSRSCRTCHRIQERARQRRVAEMRRD